MATRTYILVPDDHNLLCKRNFYGNPLLITVESDCRYYMTVHDNGAVRVHATKLYDFGNLEALKVRCPKCTSQMVPIHSSFNNDETQAFKCIICKSKTRGSSILTPFRLDNGLGLSCEFLKNQESKKNKNIKYSLG